jgi:predicted acylesterase/phospholipase RssA
MTDSAYAQPTEECDLVLKGGITSGIAYPPALLRLATRYRFRSIGGTSAGAIAAAGAAAAEYGREYGGFERLGALSAALGAGTALRDLFQPTPATRPLFDVALALAPAADGRSRPPLALRLPGALLRHDPRAFLPGALGGGALGVALALLLAALLGGTARGAGLLVPLALALLGATLGGVGLALAHLWRIATRTLPRETAYGLCPGHDPVPGPGRPPALTDWLHAGLNDLAGLPPDGAPLTFADLATRGIALRMVASNLSHGRPYDLPLRQNTFLFNADEWRRFFPEAVVAHLVRHAYQSRRVSLAGLPGYHFLPAGDLLPVVVATRLSLSFPLLLSALPLYTIATGTFRRADGRVVALAPGDLHRNWFSDGGIASNFPIHFFDAWLPTRPTFGIKLTAFPADAATRVDDLGARPDATLGDEELPAEAVDAAPPPGSGAVVLPRANVALPPEWAPIEDLVGFAGALLATAQNYRDNTQAALPSYRDRVVQVRLAAHEGGLNLAMPPATLAAVAAKGRQAGETLLREFDFDHHRWVRCQVLLNQLETNLHAMRATFDREDYAALFAAPPAAARAFPYPRTGPWRTEALRHLAVLRALDEALLAADEAWRQAHAEWAGEDFFAHDPPRPVPVLRVVPDL